MLKGKLKIKEAVDYFDSNYFLEELPRIHACFDKANYFRLYAVLQDGDGFIISPVFSSVSFESCKRHLKFAYFDYCTDYGVSHFRICSYRRLFFKERFICAYEYLVKFNFERHESLYDVR